VASWATFFVLPLVTARPKEPKMSHASNLPDEGAGHEVRTSDATHVLPAGISPHLLNVDQAAAYCGVSKSYLDKARLTGEGPPFYKIGRRVLYAVADLSAWLAERRRYSTSESR
jgi:predicted DNA-binding transcriptional regulator AlpA